MSTTASSERGRVVLCPRGRVRGLHRDAHLTLAAGGFAFAPKGLPHTFFGGPDRGKMLVWASGPKFEGLLREIAEPAAGHVVPPPPDAAPDMDVLVPIAAKWGYDILGPPGPPPGR